MYTYDYFISSNTERYNPLSLSMENENLPTILAAGGFPCAPWMNRFFRAYTIIIVNASHRIADVSS